MELRVEELAARGGVRVDTVRYYQSRGLLPPPRRQGRIALYGEDHLRRLCRIREFVSQGLTLALIGRVLDREDEARDPAVAARRDGPLLDALRRERSGSRTFTRQELATRAGIPESLIAAAQAAGLVAPIQVGGKARFGEGDLEMANAALEILEGGFPLPELLRLAVDHATQVNEVADRAIELFDAHVRKAAEDDSQRAERVGQAFRALLPPVTRLVALHFQRTLVGRALARLEAQGEGGDLRDALASTEDTSLSVAVAWR